MNDPIDAKPEITPPVGEHPKPGLHRDLQPRAGHRAPCYQGKDQLIGRPALILGGSCGIDRAIAREGALVSLSHLPIPGPNADRTANLLEESGPQAPELSGELHDLRHRSLPVKEAAATYELGIRVNTAPPRTRSGPATAGAGADPGFREGTWPGRAGRPVELIDTYVCVASNDASYVVGSTVHATGRTTSP